MLRVDSVVSLADIKKKREGLKMTPSGARVDIKIKIIPIAQNGTI